MRQMYLALSVLWVSVLCPMTVIAQEPNLRPVIEHEPVRTAVRGQPVTVLARVTDDSGHVRSATLFYAVSKDVAPFRTAMKSSGASMYYGTIPAEVLGTSGRISYYIEAMDHMDASQETPWYTMKITEPGAAVPPAAAMRPEDRQPPPAAPKRSGANLTTVAVIGGGAAAIVGGALLISQNKGDDSDGGSSAGVQVGDYDGEVTECFTLEGGAPDCGIRGMSIRIGEDGKVFSSTIKEGVVLETFLRGRSFSLTADLDPATGSSGQVMYSGTIVEDHIVGTISGEAETPEGSGVFSGSFSARKRP